MKRQLQTVAIFVTLLAVCNRLDMNMFIAIIFSTIVTDTFIQLKEQLYKTRTAYKTPLYFKIAIGFITLIGFATLGTDALLSILLTIALVSYASDVKAVL